MPDRMKARGKMGRRARLKRERTASNEAVRHHFVTARYIGLFATPRGRDGKIYVQDQRRRKEWLSKPDKVAWAEDFYRVDGDQPLMVERGLAAAEKSMVKAIEEVERTLPSQPSLEQADGVVSFVALQHVRGPEVRREFERFIGDTLRLMLEVSTGTPERYSTIVERLKTEGEIEGDAPTFEKMREFALAPKTRFSLNKGFVVPTILKQQEGVFRVIANMALTFYSVPEGAEELITGTRPVHLLPDPKVPPLLRGGLAGARAIIMPLTPRCLFIARPMEHRIRVLRAGPALVRMVNDAIEQQSEQTFSRTPRMVHSSSASGAQN
jgi:Protein of unknown function (DUF4238)